MFIIKSIFIVRPPRSHLRYLGALDKSVSLYQLLTYLRWLRHWNDDAILRVCHRIEVRTIQSLPTKFANINPVSSSGLSVGLSPEGVSKYIIQAHLSAVNNTYAITTRVPMNKSKNYAFVSAGPGKTRLLGFKR